MIKIMRGIVILTGIVFIFMILTACSSDSIFVRKNKSDKMTDEYRNAPEKEEYSYEDNIDKESDYADKELVYKNNGNDDLNSNSNSKNKERKYYANSDDKSVYDSYYQKGYASWYGREFHGRKTASGERYDMNKFTAAHKELPFGSRILVRNLENGKVVNVTVNDRGPYRNSRILDLSYAAAKKIGIVESGEAKVGILIVRNGNNEERYSNAENTDAGMEAVAGRNDENNAANDPNDDFQEASNQKSDFSIQAGAFYSRRNAEKFQKRLEKLVDNPIVLINDRDMFKVRIDKIASKKDAGRVKKLLENENISSYIVENQK